MSTIHATVQQNLCTSCGICRGVCPKNCISYRLERGMYLPVIDETACVRCGLCASVCPGLGHIYEPASSAEKTVTGTVLASYNAWSRDPELRHVSASGGVVSTLIWELLQKGAYDGAFCLDSYDYRSQLKTRLYTAEEFAKPEDTAAPKSRYLPVSHEDAVFYMKQNRDARLILVGTSCALRGLCAAIEKLKLNRENYLLIGLFCDKVFNYNVIAYWQDRYCSGAALTALHFKNKESGGWPGDMKFFPEGQDPFYVPLSDRARAKAYFMPERCLYCVDKLNARADISLGDNYTGQNESELGSNSVIIRTERGAAAWAAAEDQLEIRMIDIGDIQKAQAINLRLDNLYFGDFRAAQLGDDSDWNRGIPREKESADLRAAWKKSLKKLQAGASYDSDPAALAKQIRKDNKKPNVLIRMLRRCRRIARRVMK